MDAAGNESALTAKAFAVPGRDATAPVVSVFTPDGETPLRGTVQLSATATDNVAVTGIRFEHKAEGASAWTQIANVTSLTAGKANYTWNTVAESAGVQLTPDGSYAIRAVAYDAAANEGALADDYTISNDPPAPPSALEIYSASGP